MDWSLIAILVYAGLVGFFNPRIGFACMAISAAASASTYAVLSVLS